MHCAWCMPLLPDGAGAGQLYRLRRVSSVSLSAACSGSTRHECCTLVPLMRRLPVVRGAAWVQHVNSSSLTRHAWCVPLPLDAAGASQSRGVRHASSRSASGEPGAGLWSYCHDAVKGMDMRMDSMRPPVLSPNVVPRSYTRLNSTYLRREQIMATEG